MTKRNKGFVGQIFDAIPKTVGGIALAKTAVDLICEAEKRTKGLRKEASIEIGKIITNMTASSDEAVNKIHRAKNQAGKGLGQIIDSLDAAKEKFTPALTKEIDNFLDNLGLQRKKEAKGPVRKKRTVVTAVKTAKRKPKKTVQKKATTRKTPVASKKTVVKKNKATTRKKRS